MNKNQQWQEATTKKLNQNESGRILSMCWNTQVSLNAYDFNILTSLSYSLMAHIYDAVRKQMLRVWSEWITFVLIRKNCLWQYFFSPWKLSMSTHTLLLLYFICYSRLLYLLGHCRWKSERIFNIFIHSPIICMANPLTNCAKQCAQKQTDIKHTRVSIFLSSKCCWFSVSLTHKHFLSRSFIHSLLL